MTDVTNAKTRLSLYELIGEPFELELPDKTMLSVPQPSLKKMLLLTKFAGDMNTAEADDNITDQLAAFENFENILQQIIPQLKDYELNVPQAFALMMTLQEEAMPKKMEFLESKGITLSPKEIADNPPQTI